MDKHSCETVQAKLFLFYWTTSFKKKRVNEECNECRVCVCARLPYD